MAPETSIKLTYEDYAAIPDDGRRHEIIDGEHYVNPAPNLRHQNIVANIGTALRQHVRRDRLGSLFFAPVDVVLGDHGIVQPDVVFVSREREQLLAGDFIKGVPDLVVEVLSSNRSYDERIKYRSYERAGVLEYWIVDPDESSVRIFRRAGERFERVETGDTLTSPLLPGFALPLAEVFAT